MTTTMAPSGDGRFASYCSRKRRRPHHQHHHHETSYPPSPPPLSPVGRIRARRAGGAAVTALAFFCLVLEASWFERPAAGGGVGPVAFSSGDGAATLGDDGDGGGGGFLRFASSVLGWSRSDFGGGAGASGGGIGFGDNDYHNQHLFDERVHHRVARELETNGDPGPGGIARIFSDDRPVFLITDPYPFWFKRSKDDDQDRMCPVVKQLTGVKHHLGVAVPAHIRDNTPTPVLYLSVNCADIVNARAIGTGNWMIGFYRTRIIAALAQIDFFFTCTEGVGPKHETIKNNVLPWLRGYYPAPTVEEFGEGAWPFDKPKIDMAAACTMSYNLMRLDVMAHTIQGDMRRMAVALVGPREEEHDPYVTIPVPIYRHVDLDDAAIHFRCGDILGTTKSPCHGLIKYSAYARLISKDVKSIGIVTQPFDWFANRRLDRNTIEPCKRAVSKLVDVLEAAFPNAVVSVRNGEGETMALQYARLVMAKQTIVSPSTFGTFPLIGTFGEGYFVDGLHGEGSLVAPFIRQIVDGRKLDNVHLTKAPLLIATMIQKWGIDRTMEWVVDDLEQQDEEAIAEGR